MRPIAAALLLLASACGGPGEPAPQNDPRPPADAPAPSQANLARPAANEAIAAEDPADPGVAGMSPSQRRAYERGHRDCRAGRYQPEKYSEAYRIGCAAAQDR